MLNTMPSVKKFYVAFWILHCVLFFIGFYPMLMHPIQHMYFNEGDGIKNYFTLISYIKQPASHGLFHYTAMQYPYGDYIYFTDNSPLLAMLMRMFSLYITDTSNYAIVIMHAFIMLNMVLVPFIIWKILKKFTTNGWILLAGTLWLTWVTPQFIRIFSSTYNLSFSIFYFLAILAAIQIVEAYYENNRKKLLLNCIIIFLTIFSASFIHLYYILMLGLPAGFFMILHSILHAKNFIKRIQYFILPIFTLFCCAVCVIGVISATDVYKDLRLTVPEGSDIREYEVQFDSLYKTKHGYNTLQFIGGTAGYGGEQSIFMGNFFFYGISLLTLYYLYARFKLKKKISVSASEKKLLLLFLISALISYFSACGDWLEFGRSNTRYDNYLNPLFHIEKFYPAIDQFRYLCRIGWWFYYMFQFVFLIL
ncbi:MAG: hypothetical protein H7Y00_11590, partial [Fimbriimonadaceae bacterium]|nr:hypothetical protein [Chitinophagales bacterium]